MIKNADFRMGVEWLTVGESVLSPELRACWAGLEIILGGKCLTLVEDRATGSVRRSIVVSLYPLAEWIAFNWWSIRFDGRATSTESQRRRSFRSAGDGFAWPNLEILSAGEVSKLSWGPLVPLEGDPVQYLTDGQQWVRSEDVAEALTGLVNAVITRLEESGHSDSVLKREWDSLSRISADEAEFCEATARMGLDPFTDGIDLAESIESVFRDLDESLRNDFLDAASPGRISESLSWVLSSLEKTTSKGFVEIGAPTEWSKLASIASSSRMRPSSSSPPWVTGYEAARLLRESMGIPPASEFAFDLSVEVNASDFRPLDGVGAFDENGQGTLIMARPVAPANRRFHAARAFWHGLAVSPGVPFLLTTAQSFGQQSGRAFAAELLAPADGIRQLLGGETPWPEDIGKIATHYNVSEYIVNHQIDNQILRPPWNTAV